MGGYGSMNIVLKNNRALLSNHDRFKRPLGGFSKSKTEYDFPKASPQLLREIKKRLVEERRSRTKKIGIVFSFLMVTIVYFLISIL